MDKVGDLLIRIKNGYMASKKEVEIPFSKLSLAIVELLVKEGYVKSAKQEAQLIKVALKYDKKVPALVDVKRVSKPSQRVYAGNAKLPRVLNGLGLVIVSTPRGVMSGKQARKESLGGEVMAFVW